MTSYSDVSLMIDGAWTKGANGRTIPVINPATEEVIGQVAHAEKADLDRALEAAEKGFQQWRKVSPFDRYKIMRKAAELMRQRADEIAPIMTLEQGKPVIEAKGETLLAADIIEWMAEEGRRTYGRIVPARFENVYQLVTEGAGRPGRGLHAVELPDQPGGAQGFGGAGHRLLDHRQGSGGHARLVRRS